MDSISYITQKHCRSALPIITALLTAAMAVIALVGIGGYVGLVCAVFFGLMAFLTFLFTRGSAVGCTLLQIPLAVVAFTSFFTGIVMSAIGFAIVYYPGMYGYIINLFSQNGYLLTLPAYTAGVLLGVGALALFTVSLFTFCAVKYLNTVKVCLQNTISRHGARIFSVASILMLMIAAVVACAFVFAYGGLNAVMADSMLLSVLAEIVLLAVTLLLTSLSANAFINATFAFKVFEEKMMKVETNADGTVYVPVKEESAGGSTPVSLPIPRPTVSNAEPSDGAKKGRIKSVSELDWDDVIDGSHSEYDIL